MVPYHKRPEILATAGPGLFILLCANSYQKDHFIAFLVNEHVVAVNLVIEPLVLCSLKTLRVLPPPALLERWTKNNTLNPKTVWDQGIVLYLDE